MKGTVLKITDTDVIVDIGYKSEGVIPVASSSNPTAFLHVASRRRHRCPARRYRRLRRPHRSLQGKSRESSKSGKTSRRHYNENLIIRGRVIERIKGGLSVDIGIRAFLPGSQIDVRPVKNLDSLRGKEIECRVIKLNRKRGNIVLSRKIVLESEQARKKAFTLEVLKEDAEVRGTVKNITDYGVFIDLGGIDGLLHVTDLSWGRVNHPSELFNVGDEITVKILKYDREKERVSLGYKQLSPIHGLWCARSVSVRRSRHRQGCEPDRLRRFHRTGARSRGTDPRFGNVLEQAREASFEGAAGGAGCRSRCSRCGHGEPPDFSGSQADRSRIRGRHLAERYAIGSVISGRVRNLTDFGAFIEVEEGIDGLVHVSDISPRRIKHPSEVLKKGEQVEAVILNIDTENHRLSLGIKQLQPDIWEQFFTAHHAGDHRQRPSRASCAVRSVC